MDDRPAREALRCEHNWELRTQLRLQRRWVCSHCQETRLVHARVKRVKGMGDVICWPMP